MNRFAIKRIHLFFILIVGAVIAGVIAGALLAFTRDLPQIRSLESFEPAAITRIYTSDHVQLDELFVEKRDPVSLETIPDDLKNALVATEDRNFYRHFGVDLKGIARAIVKDILAGDFVEGASTITQQLAKTLFLTPRKTVKRKIREAILAFQLERRYTKDEILKLYLNQVYYGSGAYGVQSAARIFFDKPVADLDLSESALIVAMLKAPSRYSPLVNPELAVKRRNIVLKQMHKTGVISESMMKAASDLPFIKSRNQKDQRLAPYFMEYIKPVLEEKVGASVLYKGGLKIVTTLDSVLQKAAEVAVAKGLAELQKRMDQKGLPAAAPQCALVCLDVQTGAILAWVGGRNYEESPFDRVASAKRQPGSAFKPIVYAFAIENGFTQASPLLDLPVAYRAGRKSDMWRPENFSQTFSGEMTLRKALAHSKNIPAVRLLETLDPATVIPFARSLGIRSRLLPNLSLALGTSETALLELTSAYAVFPNRGMRISPFGIQKIIDPKMGAVIHHTPQKAVVMSREGAAVMADILKGVVMEGTGQKAKVLGRPVAGKTGTTNDYRDALFIGFSPTLAAGVWVGQDRHVTIGKGETGARAALPIWIDFMREALKQRPYGYFDIPDGVVKVGMDPVTGMRVPLSDSGAVPALFKRGTEPMDSGA